MLKSNFQQAPLSRFSDTASNTGVLTYMNSHPEYSHLPIYVKTVGASTCAALLRVLWMPVDTMKTTLQVEGKDGLKLLRQRVRQDPKRLYYGAVGAMVAKWSAHFPFFYCYNYLQTQFEMPSDIQSKLLRNGAIGFVSSILSDSCANTFRVLKVISWFFPGLETGIGSVFPCEKTGHFYTYNGPAKCSHPRTDPDLRHRNPCRTPETRRHTLQRAAHPCLEVPN